VTSAGKRIRIVAVAAAAALLASPAASVATTTAPTTTPPDKHEIAEASRWGLVIGLAVFVLPSALAWFVSWRRAVRRGSPETAKGFRHLLVGQDNRFSVSKTAAVVWTYLLASTLLGIVIAKWIGHPQPFDKISGSGLEGQYALLFGGPIGAAILAKGIVASQTTTGGADKPPASEGPSLSQLINNDAGNTDLGNLQYVLFNLVAIVYFVGTFVQSPQDGLPHMPDVLLALTSVSAVAYVGKKALPVTPSATLAPTSGAAGSVVKITGTGLRAGISATAPVTVLFGATPVVPSKVEGNGTDTVTVAVPPGLPANTPVDVVVVTPTLTHVKAGSFTVTT